MTKPSVPKNALPDEARRTILRESLTRFNHELMDDGERQLLRDRILRLRRQLRLELR